TTERVGPLLNIWFASSTRSDDLCQPFAGVVRELKAKPPTLVGGEWDTLEGKVAKVLLAVGQPTSGGCNDNGPGL
ncbi:MAG: hypothetical protein P8M25_16530, partial [Paracoccaceae bacterium]|nr:hypothetical protein [Paracoccaceae bacterium]